MNSIFKYNAINLNGEKIKGEFDSSSISELNLALRNKGYFLLDFKTKRRNFKEIFYRKVTLHDLSILCGGLSNMASSGISISQALNIIEDLNDKKHIKESLGEIKRSVIKGETIYNSIKKFSCIYPTFMVEMIRVGEESGRMDEVLRRLSEYYENQNRIFIKIKTAVMYPLIVFIASIFIVTFLIMKIIPQFMEILKYSGGEIPFITRIVLSSHEFLKTNLFAISIILFFIIFLVFSYSKTLVGRTYFDKIKITAPFFKVFYNKLIMARFATSIGLLITSGFTVLRSLEITKSILVNKVVEIKIVNLIEDIKKGESIYYSFKKQSLGNNLFLSLIKIGEETGNLDKMLLKSGEIFDKDVEEGLKKIVVFIEPITILFLSLFIGTFVIAAFMPIFSIIDSIN